MFFRTVNKENVAGVKGISNVVVNKRAELPKKSSEKDIELNVKVINPVFGLQYIHKKEGNKNVWYFANLGDNINVSVALKGEYDLTAFDPKTKEEKELKYQIDNGYTKIDLSVDKGESLLITEK